MANIAVINCVNLSEYAFKPLADGRTSLQRVTEYASKLPGVTELICLQGNKEADLQIQSQKYRSVKGVVTVEALLHALADLSAADSGVDSIFYVYGDTPFLNPELSSRMWQNHNRYRADFTFADAYPAGLAPEIIRCQAVAPLATLAVGNTGKIERDTLFEVIRKDINAFEIETEIPPVDLRLLRIRLAAENKGTFGMIHKLDAEGFTDAETFLNRLNSNQLILRTLPSYLSVQITGWCPQKCSYCPYSQTGGDILNRHDYMDLNNFDKLIQQFLEFAGSGYVNLSPWGEPAGHPQITEIIESVTRRGLTAVIETSGLGWSVETLQALAANNRDRIVWIVSLDAHTEATYRVLRGEGFAEARKACETLLELFPETAYVQAVRMDTNEEELELFYRSWKERTENIIIQKYDFFSGSLPQRRIADISPLNRHACWHLKRDLTVLLNGDVPLCREDLKHGHRLGNVFSDGIEVVWQKGQEYYKQHLADDLPEICRECDEYYTYNY